MPVCRWAPAGALPRGQPNDMEIQLTLSDLHKSIFRVHDFHKPCISDPSYTVTNNGHHEPYTPTLSRVSSRVHVSNIVSNAVTIAHRHSSLLS